MRSRTWRRSLETGAHDFTLAGLVLDAWRKRRNLSDCSGDGVPVAAAAETQRRSIGRLRRNPRSLLGRFASTTPDLGLRFNRRVRSPAVIDFVSPCDPMKSRVLLLPIEQNDQDAFLEAVASSVKLHRLWVTPPRTPEAFRAFASRMRGPTNFGFVVRASDTGALVGFIEITNIVRGIFCSGYLGYYAFAGHQRLGLMTQAIRVMARVAFSALKLHRLEANIQPENLASVALVRACGFTKEGYSARYLKIRGRWRDHERWALLAR